MRARAKSMDSPTIKLEQQEQPISEHEQLWFAAETQEIAAFSAGLTLSEESDEFEAASVARECDFTSLKPCEEQLEVHSVRTRDTSRSSCRHGKQQNNLELPAMNLTAAEFKPNFSINLTRVDEPSTCVESLFGNAD